MSVLTPYTFTIGSLSRAAYKAASARLRQWGVREESTNWIARATMCERCPMKVVQKGISYCGKPYLQQIERDEALQGCGCPTRAKAKDPSEHCPVNQKYLASTQSESSCDCKWCSEK